ncbi:1-phosphofructokinase family hexose kinase [Ralstonia insidiosa]|jgi:6-phosphofructokinase 2|uniref:1-phosphofructokinase family hexose kinase n=1 Tax=Ralstonia TaxID=48736 RepID=UPI0006648EB8|nr:1-phosphofructokinase family hexose kinase [Ralstonia insidiosa]KMW48596.1 phosphofructokinase [Ralstonia sp. MD27]MBX3772688.1 1-phosphofructokinase family hexose kinase [Ralstonia pickettii]NOZ17624.1 1-phosphofructokinase family hexose kinase [Betaproteobacteria bacterium]MBA9856534.1 1-phosphofructokinase family hexose kinase [Ralstonia insidiosa]MBA9869113.1 1-phosphofructokinase family hexose kinase [Ralstonia insidiosa]
MAEIVTLTVNPAIDIATSVERMTDTHKMRCAPARCDPGGGGINVARVVHRLGGDCLAVYLAGGPMAARLERLLTAEGLPFEPLQIEGETRENFSVTETSTHREFRFVMPGPVVSEVEWQHCLDRLDALQPAPRYLVLSGSLPLGVPEDFYARVIQMAKARGSRVVLDASEPALHLALPSAPYLIKPSLNELRQLTGLALETEADCLAAARGIVRAGHADVVALTLGASGAMLVTQDDVAHACPVATSVHSTIGAGDSFVGAMVWALNRGADVRQAFRYGVAAAGAALRHAGTELGSAAEIEQCYQGVLLSSAASVVSSPKDEPCT